MSKETGREQFISGTDTPITLITKSHNDRDDDSEVKEFQVRDGNRTVLTTDDEDKARDMVKVLGGNPDTGAVTQRAVAAEIGGTAAHQAMHAEDTEKLAKLIDESVKRALDAAEGKGRGQTKKERDRPATLSSDSQASGVAPMHLGLQPDASPVVIERVPGAADNQGVTPGQPTSDAGAQSAPTARADNEAGRNTGAAQNASNKDKAGK